MSFTFPIAESDFTGLTASEPNTARLFAEIEENTTIATTVLDVTWNKPDLGVGLREIIVLFDGAGPLPGPEDSELTNTIVPGHTGEPLEDIPVPTVTVVEGLNLTYQTASTVDVEVGKISSSGLEMLIALDSPLTLDLTVSGAGGIDTGSEASDTWYAVYICGQTNGLRKPVVVASTNFTTPTLPAGYNTSRRIGSIKNAAGGDIFKFRQFGGSRLRFVDWDEDREALPQRVLENGNAGSFSDIDLSDVVPESSELARVEFQTNFGGGGVRIRPDGFTDANGTEFLGLLSQAVNLIGCPGQIIEYESTGTVDLTVDALGYVETI